jgi:hypothetical protein
LQVPVRELVPDYVPEVEIEFEGELDFELELELVPVLELVRVVRASFPVAFVV